MVNIQPTHLLQKSKHCPEKAAITESMDSILPQVRSTSELAPGHEGRATPFSQQTIVLTKQAYIQLKWEAHYWGIFAQPLEKVE